MAFNPYTPPLLNRAQSGAMPDLIGHFLSGYGETTKNRYLPKSIEADIFHKQISPLAMLASSPYFSSLHPEQQKQIAGYISQMLSKQGMGAGMQPGAQPQQQGGTGGVPGAMNQGNAQMSEGGDSGEGGLVPTNPGEHFTDKFAQSAYTGGVPHRGAGGETIYTPTGSAVEQGTKVLREAKGLKPLLEKFSTAAQDIAKGGPIKESLSTVGSNIKKTTSNIPYVNDAGNLIGDLLGGGKLSNQRSKLESSKTQMKPVLNALGFTDKDIESMFKIYPGETSKNIKDRMEKTMAVIDRKIKTHAKNLRLGQQINSPGTAIANSLRKDESNDIHINHTAKLFHTTPDVVKEAQKMGVKTAKEFRDFIRWRNENS